MAEAVHSSLALQGSGEIKYRLTPEIIRQIFVEYPGVKKVYDEHVPTKISEKDFWKVSCVSILPFGFEWEEVV